MKKLFIAGVAFAASVSAANATCSKANLSGNWLFTAGGVQGWSVAVANGQFGLVPNPTTIWNVAIATYGPNCKGMASLKMTDTSTTPYVTLTLPANVAGEVLGTTSAKPNRVHFRVSTGTFFQDFILLRQP